MTRGDQVDLGGLRVDRPIWGSPDQPEADGRDGPTTPDPRSDRRLPRMRAYSAPRAGDDHVSRPHAVRADAPHRAGDVDIDLTVPWPAPPAGLPVDIDLTRPLPTGRVVEAPLSERREVADLLRHDGGSGSPYRVPRSSSHVDQRRRWTDRKLRRVYRRLRPPQASMKVERWVLAVAAGTATIAVLCTVAVGVRTKIGNEVEFVQLSAELHRDPEVADAVSRQVANGLAGSGAIEPEAALDVKLLLEDLIVSDEFEPMWRTSLANAHDMAFHPDTAPSPVSLDDALPELAEELKARDLAKERAIRNTSVGVVNESYVTELQGLTKTLDRLLLLGVPAVLVSVVVTLRRSRNTYRAAGLIAGSTVLGALVVMALAPRLGQSAIEALVAEPARVLAIGATEGILPSVRTLLFGLALVSGILAVASRMEEVRMTPFVAAANRHLRRSSRSKSGSRRRRPTRASAPRSAFAVGESSP